MTGDERFRAITPERHEHARGPVRQRRADLPHRPFFRSARRRRNGAGSDEIMKFLIAREILKEVKG